MFRDKDEALQRLEDELLAPDAAADAPRVRAYNPDPVDVELDAFSEDVYAPAPGGHRGLTVLLFLLLCGIFCILAWWLLRYKGVI